MKGGTVSPFHALHGHGISTARGLRLGWEPAMGYRKITLEAMVHEDDAEAFTQALNNALDSIEETTAVYGGGITDTEAGEPENAAEIAAPAR